MGAVGASLWHAARSPGKGEEGQQDYTFQINFQPQPNPAGSFGLEMMLRECPYAASIYPWLKPPKRSMVSRGFCLFAPVSKLCLKAKLLQVAQRQEELRI